MRVLVTGGAGFIGATTSAALLRAGHEVVVVDDLSTGHRDAVPPEAEFVRGDIADRAVVEPVVADGIDACIHFAALIEAGESMRSPERFFRVNTAGSAQLLEVLLTHGVRRFVLSSTAAVYGEPERTPISEDAPLAPTNAYGESKLLVERMLDWHHRIHGLRTAALRYFNAAGATPGRGERHDPETHLIPLILQVAAGRREAISVFGTDYPTPDGTAVRDYVHVADLADAHVLALEALDVHDRLICNLGNGTGFGVREVIEAARRVTGHPIPATDAERRPGDPASLVASADRARELLGWQPTRRDLDLIVADAWTEHPDRSSAHEAPR
jgi:UDP-glucose 4-epimerase